MTAAAPFPASYFDGRSSREWRVRVEVDGEVARIRGEGTSLDLPVRDLKVQPRIGRLPVRIELPAGGVLVAQPQDVQRALRGAAHATGLAQRLESHVGAVAASLAGVVALLWLFYAFGIPWLAREIAYRLPPATEAGIATEALGALDRYFFKPSSLPEARKERVRSTFAALAEKSGSTGPRARLEFRDGGIVGPNALAIPGGVVVVTDQLLELLPDDDRVAAVLAHELGHLEHRHGARHILQDTISGLLMLAVMGDASAVAGVAATAPTVLLHAGYSRDFEREADRHAYGLLRTTGRSPRLMGDALAALEEAFKARKARRGEDVSETESDRSYISTHPATSERIRAAQEAAAQPERK